MRRVVVALAGVSALMGAPAMASAPAPVEPRNQVVSLSTGGAVGDFDSGGTFVSVENRNEVDLSATGRFVAFESSARNLVGRRDTNNRPDVFVRDRDADRDGIFDEAGAVTTTIVSVGTGGQQEYGEASGAPSISGDGRFVAFHTYAKLTPEDTNDAGDVYVRDRDFDRDGIYDEPGAVRTTRVSVGPAGEQGNNGSNNPEITPDGRFVVFASIATTLLSSQDSDFSDDIYLRDRDPDRDGVFDERNAVRTELVSGPVTGPKVQATSSLPSITPNGRFVVWHSTGGGWDATDRNRAFDIYVRDRVRTTITRLSKGMNGADSDHESHEATISADGRWVAFSSQATNLVPQDTNEIRDIFVVDRDPDRDRVYDEAGTNRIERISVGTNGEQADAWSTGPSMSADGRIIVFESEASTIGLTSVHPDIYVRDRDTDRDKVYDEPTASATALMVYSHRGGPPNGTSVTPVISSNRRWVAFASYAENLVGGARYINNRTDVFVRGPFVG